MRAGLTQHFGARDSGQIQIKDECLVGGGRGGEFGCGRLAVRPVSGIAAEEPENMDDDLGDRGTIFRHENMGPRNREWRGRDRHRGEGRD